MDHCELLCYFEPNCVSFNFENKVSSVETSYNCDLNNSTHRRHDGDFVDEKGYFYRGADVSTSCFVVYVTGVNEEGMRGLGKGSEKMVGKNSPPLSRPIMHRSPLLHRFLIAFKIDSFCPY